MPARDSARCNARKDTALMPRMPHAARLNSACSVPSRAVASPRWSRS